MGTHSGHFPPGDQLIQPPRFNEFAFTQDLDWRSAMLEIILLKYSLPLRAVYPPTRTPTSTPRWYQDTDTQLYAPLHARLSLHNPTPSAYNRLSSRTPTRASTSVP